jgi:hypothetical protein
MKRSINSVSDFAEYVNEGLKNRATETVTATKFVANKVFAY